MTALPRIQTPALIPTQTESPVLPAGFTVFDNRLFYRGLDMLGLVDSIMEVNGQAIETATPLYVRRLAALRQNYRALHQWFALAKQALAYPGDLTVAYASKANPSKPVSKTLILEGAAYECSSAFDVDIVRHAATNGWLDKTRTVFANGFKLPRYADKLIALRRDGFAGVTPIFDDLEEITPFINSGLDFECGLRSLTDSDKLNRFGMDAATMQEAAKRIAQAGNLRLTIYHAMQTVSAGRGLQYQAMLARSVRRYAALRRHVPTLHRFNFGGGLPASSSDLDFQEWMFQTLETILRVCAEEGVPAPDLIIESGRYLVQSHASRMFRVVKTRMGEDGVPYYIIDGSIMSTFPDAWALGEAFTVLPVNNWEGPFVPARLAGLTCDQDDVYPTHAMADAPLLMLPADADGLIVGFFDCGAYQETIGGRGGAKHCLLPEGEELIIDEDADAFFVGYTPAQDEHQVLANMGYRFGCGD
jgi:arginine decarboxylase